MALAKIQKIIVAGLRKSEPSVLEALQQFGTVQISEMNYNKLLGTGDVNNGLGIPPTEEIAHLESIILFLKKVAGKRELNRVRPLEVPRFTRQQIVSLVKRLPVEEWFKYAVENARELDNISIRLADIDEEITRFRPYINIEVKFDALARLEKVRILMGSVERKKFSELVAQLSIETGKAAISEISQTRTHKHLVIGFSSSEAQKIMPVLRGAAFETVDLPDTTQTPAEYIESLEEEKTSLISRRLEIIEKARGLLSEFGNMQVALDFYRTIANRERIKQHIGESKQAFMLAGWIESKRSDWTKQEIEKKFPDVVALIESPGIDEKPPVKFENKAPARSFELVTTLYGWPKYGSIDPTPYLTPFFIIFFGCCLSDAGYGLILASGCWWALRHFKPRGSLASFLRVFFWGGISSIAFGIVLGTYFGDALTAFSPFAALSVVTNKFIMLDPIKNPTSFLYVSLVFGYIQVIFGVLLKFIHHISRAQWSSAFCDELPWLAVLAGVAMLIIPATRLPGQQLAIGGVVAVVIVQGRSIKNPFGRIGLGLYRLYGGIDYLKDILSYSRLFALGLGTGIMGMAVNTMSKMVVGIPYIGWLLMAIVLIIGHVFNMAINMLSGYVHTSRLQYVEFFPKFFEGTGQPFAPLREEQEHVIITG